MHTSTTPIEKQKVNKKPSPPHTGLHIIFLHLPFNESGYRPMVSQSYGSVGYIIGLMAIILWLSTL